MKKVDSTVRFETLYIAAFALIFSGLMQSVFLMLQKWDYNVLFGNLLGAFAAVLNFFLMGLTVQSAVLKEEKEAKNLIKLSQGLRFLMLVAFAVIGYTVPVFNVIAVIIPYLFPRIAIAIRPLFFKNH